MELNLFEVEIKELKESIVLKLKNDYKEYELFNNIIKQVFNNNFFGIKFTKEIISAVDSFDQYFSEKNKTELKPISHFITSVNPFNGLPFFNYRFHYSIHENTLKINLTVSEIESNSYLEKKVKEIINIFTEYVNDENLKKRMINQLKEMYSESIDKSFDILQNYINSSESFTEEDIIDLLSYNFLGLEYYGANYENNKR